MEKLAALLVREKFYGCLVVLANGTEECTQKQSTVTLSSCEAEFMAATAADCQAIWLKEMPKKLTGQTLQGIKLLVDNKSAIELMKNSVFIVKVNTLTQNTI
ncbi:hypothetical protein E3N88_26407 [Mikania micrantha]|uniref:Reverse transcriptase Ty1/copia-type domain-containing protein n=1 Tax=Mikania micrantha TaxID=192012 RepID=A0A5N6NA68_9ASTR|nr:hypothetical protein E3N88_26407 [Mikania micrantha]